MSQMMEIWRQQADEMTTAEKQRLLADTFRGARPTFNDLHHPYGRFHNCRGPVSFAATGEEYIVTYLLTDRTVRNCGSDVLLENDD